MNEELKKCKTEVCDRQVRVQITHCCIHCVMADQRMKENPGWSTIISHTEDCNSRHLARGGFPCGD